jgi:hypothetical protein
MTQNHRCNNFSSWKKSFSNLENCFSDLKKSKIVPKNGALSRKHAFMSANGFSTHSDIINQVVHILIKYNRNIICRWKYQNHCGLGGIIDQIKWVLSLHTFNSKKMGIVSFSAFTKLGQDAVAMYANNNIKLMTADPQFAALAKEVGVLKTSNDAYVAALSNNVNGGRVATMEKEKCKKELIKQLKTAALLVNIMADGDDSVIMAAGFDVRKAAESYDVLEAPDVLKIINETTAGLVTVKLAKVAGAYNYGILKRIKVETNDAAWENGEYSSALKFQLSGLESGKTYQFQFRALGNKGLVSPYSSVVETLVS